MCANEDVPSWLRQHRAPVLLSSLLLSGDDDASLKSFVRRLPRTKTTPAELRAVRELAVSLCYALLSERAEDWRTIAQAARAGRSIARPRVGDEPATTGKGAEDQRPEHLAMPLPRTQPTPDRVVVEREESEVAPPAVSHRDLPPPPPTDLDATGTVDTVALFGSLAENPSGLPFESASVHCGPVIRTSPAAIDAPHDEAGATGEIDPSVVASIFAGIPVSPSEWSRLPMTVDQYAALVARTKACPGVRQDAIHAEYGVRDSAHRKRIDDAFDAALAANSALRDRYQQAYGQWVAWLHASRRG